MPKLNVKNTPENNLKL